METYSIHRACGHEDTIESSKTDDLLAAQQRLLNNTKCARCRTADERRDAAKAADRLNLPALDGDRYEDANIIRVRKYEWSRIAVGQLVRRGHSQQPLVDAFNRLFSVTRAQFWLDHKLTTPKTLLGLFLQEKE